MYRTNPLHKKMTVTNGNIDDVFFVISFLYRVSKQGNQLQCLLRCSLFVYGCINEFKLYLQDSIETIEDSGKARFV